MHSSFAATLKGVVAVGVLAGAGLVAMYAREGGWIVMSVSCALVSTALTTMLAIVTFTYRHGEND